MKTMKTIKEKHLKRKKWRFINRETERSFLKRQLEIKELEFNILFFYGIAGVGKSSLLDEAELLCRSTKVKYVRIDIAEMHDTIKILRELRTQINPQKIFTPFKNFDQHLEYHIEIVNKLKDEGAFEGFIDLATSLGGAADPTGTVGKFLSEKASNSMKSLKAYLSKPQIDFYVNTEKFLTQTFQDGINKILKSRFAIIIDTYEQASRELDRWFQQDFIPDLHSEVLVIIAGRKRPSILWSDWIADRLMKTIELLNFNAQDTQQYLKTLGVHEEELIKEVFALTEGHPLSISLGAELGITPQTKFIVSETLVDRIFENIENSEIITFFKVCSCVRFFNPDIINALTGKKLEHLFKEIQDFSFVREYKYGFTVHELVRSRLQMKLSRMNYKLFQEFHAKALAYFQAELKTNRAKESKEYFYQILLENLYHQLQLSEEKGIALYVSTFLNMDILGNKPFMNKLLQEADNWTINKTINKDWIIFCHGRLAFSERRFSDAIEIFRSISDQSPTSENTLLLVYSCNRLSQIFSEVNQLDLAVLYARRALKLSEVTSNMTEQARAINALANALQHQGKSLDALEYFEESFLEVIPDPLQKGEAFTLAMVCYRDVGEYDKSVGFGYRALEIWQGFDYPSGVGIAMYNIASTLLLKGDLKQAEQALKETRTIFERLDDALWIARCLTRLGEVCLKKSEMNMAMQYFEESLVIRKELGDNYGILIVKILQAEVMLKTKEIDNAQALYKEIVQLAHSGGNHQFHLKAIMGIAKINLLKGRLNHAEQWISKAEELMKTAGIENGTELANLQKEIQQKKAKM